MPCAQLDTRVIDMAARTKPRGLDLDSWTCPLFDYSTFRLENSPEKKMMARLRASISPHKYHNMTSARLIQGILLRAS